MLRFLNIYALMTLAFAQQTSMLLDLKDLKLL